MKKIGWAKRDEEHGKYQILVSISPTKLIWKARYKRNETAETYTPSDEDWDTLGIEVQRRIQRRKMTPDDMKMVKKRGRK